MKPQFSPSNSHLHDTIIECYAEECGVWTHLSAPRQILRWSSFLHGCNRISHTALQKFNRLECPDLDRVFWPNGKSKKFWDTIFVFCLARVFMQQTSTMCHSSLLFSPVMKTATGRIRTKIVRTLKNRTVWIGLSFEKMFSLVHTHICLKLRKEPLCESRPVYLVEVSFLCASLPAHQTGFPNWTRDLLWTRCQE